MRTRNAGCTQQHRADEGARPAVQRAWAGRRARDALGREAAGDALACVSLQGARVAEEATPDVLPDETLCARFATRTPS